MFADTVNDVAIVHCLQDGRPPRYDLPAQAQLYVACTASSVLLTAGRYQDASSLLDDAGMSVLASLHEAGADRALWHSMRGLVRYRVEDNQVWHHGEEHVRVTGYAHCMCCWMGG